MSPRGVLASVALLITVFYMARAQSVRAPSTTSAYVDPAACATCHAPQAATYQQTGMGRSFSRPARQNTPEGTYYHEASTTYYAMIERAGRYFQRQYQLGFDGKETSILEKQVDYIIGSGNHSRTYLHRTPDNHLIELPLAWYSEKGGYWAMNPGYDRPDHEGFRRRIGYDCMFCHNAVPAGEMSNGKFPSTLPEGIDCQRCHGPGQKHVDLARGASAAKLEIRAAIVNPARLPSQRQAEVCLQCHLETTSFPLPNSLVRYERGPFSYRPGEPLSDFKLFFDKATPQASAPAFEIAGAAYQLNQSACILKSGEKLSCTTCHNPHDIKHGAQATQRYSAICRDCHAAPFNRLVAAGKHTTSPDCTTCHMPKRRTEDVVHVAMTDHRIQRFRPAADLLADIPERGHTSNSAYRGEVALYYPPSLPKPDDELYLATAQVIESSNLTAGITRLTAAIAKYRPERSEPYLQLADALRNAGRCPEAIPVYAEARRRDPASLPAMQKTALCLGSAGAEAILREALQTHASDAITWVQFGIAQINQSHTRDGIAAFEKAIALDPELPEAWNSLGGVLLETGQMDAAERALRNAVRYQPNYAEVHNNLGTLFARTSHFDEAAWHYEAALRYKPDYNFARYNYGVALARVNRLDDAQLQFETALRNDPTAAETHQVLGVVLANKGQPAQALEHYKEAVRLRPDFARANLSAGQSLAASGEIEQALPYLRKAAQSKDSEAAKEAIQILQQLKGDRRI